MAEPSGVAGRHRGVHLESIGSSPVVHEYPLREGPDSDALDGT